MYYSRRDQDFAQEIFHSGHGTSRNRIERAKRLFDLVAASFGCSVALIVGILLLLMNPVFNPGPLLFRQERMGRHGRKFTLWKFRTMLPCPEGRSVRPTNAPLEEARITKLGRVLRRCRVDELPNFLNVLRGEMSVIGPRPDAWEHALHYSAAVEAYRHRFEVLPGITGLAQVVGGYADCHDATRRKARFDKFYVEHRSIALEVLIVWRTLRVIVGGFGAR